MLRYTSSKPISTKFGFSNLNHSINLCCVFQNDVDRAALMNNVSRSLAFGSDEGSNGSDSDDCVFEDSDGEDKEENGNNFDDCCSHCKSLRKACKLC